MARARGRRDHRLRYVHGVLPVWRFAADGAGGRSGIASALRGVLVHGVLERIQDEAEVAELLDVVVGSVDDVELERQLVEGSALRASIEAEIARVVTSPEWKWYVQGEHWRELRFVQFRSPGRWRVGAMDLYRSGPRPVIVDFKTQDVAPEEVVAEAAKYRLQAVTYRAVCAGLGAGAAEVRFHFTAPGVVAS